MHIELFVHADGRTPRCSINAWWHDGGGIHHAELVHCEAIDVNGDERDPWSLLAAVYLKLAEVKSLRQPSAAPE